LHLCHWGLRIPPISICNSNHLRPPSLPQTFKLKNLRSFGGLSNLAVIIILKATAKQAVGILIPQQHKCSAVTCHFHEPCTMNSYRYKDLTIQVVDEPAYEFRSSTNNFNYQKYFFGGGGQEYPTSKHGIKILQNDKILNSCIVIGSGGATGIHQNSALLDSDDLLLCCCDTVFCLSLPALDLKWKTQADQATCFQIFKQQNDYIIHGELQVTKLDKEGRIKWQFSGADIFVSADNEEEFKMESDGILLTDFAKTKYKLDFDGKLMWDTYKQSR